MILEVSCKQTTGTSTVVTLATGGVGAGLAGYIAAAALKGAVFGALTGAATGTVSGAISHRITPEVGKVQVKKHWKVLLQALCGVQSQVQQPAVVDGLCNLLEVQR